MWKFNFSIKLRGRGKMMKWNNYFNFGDFRVRRRRSVQHHTHVQQFCALRARAILIPHRHTHRPHICGHACNQFRTSDISFDILHKPNLAIWAYGVWEHRLKCLCEQRTSKDRNITCMYTLHIHPYIVYILSVLADKTRWALANGSRVCVISMC